MNLTNDAWYWGSSELDMHLACDVFRAVETRKPLVIAANGGISAWIDACGRVRAQSPRQTPDVIIADVERGPLPQLLCGVRRLVRRRLPGLLRRTCFGRLDVSLLKNGKSPRRHGGHRESHRFVICYF